MFFGIFLAIEGERLEGQGQGNIADCADDERSGHISTDPAETEKF
jgi:hypothetical protein